MTCCNDVLDIISKCIGTEDPEFLLYLRQNNKEDTLTRLNVDYFKNRHVFAQASEDFLWAFRHELFWEVISIVRPKIDHAFVEKFKEFMDWTAFTKYHRDDMDIPFIIRYQRYVDWQYISMKFQLPLKFVVDYMDKLDLFIILQQEPVRVPINVVRYFKDDFIEAQNYAINHCVNGSLYHFYFFHNFDVEALLVEDYIGTEDDDIKTHEMVLEIVDAIRDDQHFYNEYEEEYTIRGQEEYCHDDEEYTIYDFFGNNEQETENFFKDVYEDHYPILS